MISTSPEILHGAYTEKSSLLERSRAAIQHCRQVALSLLKPSKRDLEAGFRIHRESLVIEPYSLGLQAPSFRHSIAKIIQQNASALEIQDQMGEDRVMNWLASEETLALYRQAWEAAGVSCLFLNSGVESNQPLQLLKRLALQTHLIDKMPDFLSRGTSAEQIEHNFRNGKRTICFALNGIPLAGRQLDLHDEISYIRVFAQLGAKAMHLTYNRRNLIGDGCGEPNDGGLSDFGQYVVDELNRLGILIDLAHTGWKTSLDVAKRTQSPVIISHSAIHALNAHIRCKPDNVIQAVVETGGIMGITNVPPFLGGSGDINAFLNHIDYAVAKFGADAVAIGTDHSYRLPGHNEELAGLPIPKRRTAWESLWPKTHLALRTNWETETMLQSMAWTNWPLFTVGLVQRGYSEETIRKILGENVLRVAKAVWK